MSTTSPPPEGPSGPEFLEQGGGDPVPPSSSGGNGRRTAVLAGGAVVLLAAAGAATWAAMSFLGSGAQPAEALPSSTLAYMSADVDPSGAQKIEAIRMLNKFPALKEELGLDAEDDIRRKVFEEEFGDCESISYADDVEPWLGNSLAVAAVEAGDDAPSVVAVLGVTDADAAEEGLPKLAECEDDGEGGFAIEGDWAILAETDAIAEKVVAGAGEATLADSSTYQDWTDQVGDPGVISMYAAPEAGSALVQLLGSEQAAGELPPKAAEETTKALEDFGGGAAAVRFSDGAVEMELAADLPQDNAIGLPLDEDATLDLVDSLPDNTAIAYGAALPEGWADALLTSLGNYGIPPEQIEQGLAMAEQQTGLTLPEDLETLLGEQFALALGGDFDVEALMNSADPSGVPLGVKVRGEAAEIEDIMGKLGQASGNPAKFETETAGDDIVWSLSPDFRSSLASGGSLGESEAYQDVVPEADDAASVLFVNFDAGDWLSGVSQMDPEAGKNVEPLDALGISGGVDDGTSRGLVRLTTD